MLNKPTDKKQLKLHGICCDRVETVDLTHAPSVMFLVFKKDGIDDDYYWQGGDDIDVDKIIADFEKKGD